MTGQGHDARVRRIVQLPVQLNKQPGGLDVYGAQVAGRCRLAQVDHRPGRFGRQSSPNRRDRFLAEASQALSGRSRLRRRSSGRSGRQRRFHDRSEDARQQGPILSVKQLASRAHATPVRPASLGWRRWTRLLTGPAHSAHCFLSTPRRVVLHVSLSQQILSPLVCTALEERPSNGAEPAAKRGGQQRDPPRQHALDHARNVIPRPCPRQAADRRHAT